MTPDEIAAQKYLEGIIEELPQPPQFETSLEWANYNKEIIKWLRNCIEFGIAHARNPIKIEKDNLPPADEWVLVGYQDYVKGTSPVRPGKFQYHDEYGFHFKGGESWEKPVCWWPLPQIPTVEGEGIENE